MKNTLPLSAAKRRGRQPQRYGRLSRVSGHYATIGHKCYGNLAQAQTGNECAADAQRLKPEEAAVVELPLSYYLWSLKDFAPSLMARKSASTPSVIGQTVPPAKWQRNGTALAAASPYAACAWWLTSLSASLVSVSSVFFSSARVASSSFTACFRPSSAPQVFSVP